MKILKRIGIGLLAIIVLLLIAGIFMPKHVTVEREVTIAKPKTEVFSYIRMLKNQNYYSKWAMMEPTMKKSYRGTDGTPGFVSAWEGEDVGKGEQEILAIAEGARMDTELRFEKPFKSKAAASMRTEAAGEGQTKVKWIFDQDATYPFNVMVPLMKWAVGNDFQTGLDNLKKNLESGSPQVSQLIK